MPVEIDPTIGVMLPIAAIIPIVTIITYLVAINI
jgi:hypothetical protein